MTRITELYIGLSGKDMENQQINPKMVIDFIKERVNAGTFKEAKGLWNGETENSLIFECADIENSFREDAYVNTVKDLKEELEEVFDQDSVMVKSYDAKVAF